MLYPAFSPSFGPAPRKAAPILGTLALASIAGREYGQYGIEVFVETRATLKTRGE